MAITVGYGYDRYGIVGKGGRGGGEEKKEESAKSERFFVETGVNSAEREKCRAESTRLPPLPPRSVPIPFVPGRNSECS